MAGARARKRKRARHCGGHTDIADDVLLEAFARLPGLQDLLRCAATCKRWRRLVTDRAFLRRLGHWPDTARRPSILAGIFYQDSYPAGSLWSPRSKNLSFLYTPPQFLSLQPRGGVSPLTFDSFFAFDDDDTLFDLATPLASRRGFLLVRVLLGGDRNNLHLAVCCDKRSTRLLPPPPFTNSWNGCAILDDDDCSLDHKQQPPMRVFQVVLIYTDYDGWLCACTYSSNTGSWNEAPVECSRASGFTMCGPQAGVVTPGGTVHWLFMDKTNLVYYTLNINVGTSHVSLTAIPFKVHASPPIPCIAGEEGRLSFVTIRRHGAAKLWTKQEKYEDGGDGESGGKCNGVWRCSELADLGRKRIGLVFFAESRGALIVQQGGAFSIVDLKSKKLVSMHLEEQGKGHVSDTHRFARSCSSTFCCGHPGWTCEHTPPVLYEMDWVFRRTLASSRLGDDIRVD